MDNSKGMMKRATNQEGPSNLPAAHGGLENDLTLSQMAEKLVKSGFFSDVKDANQAIVKIQAGREMGIGPIASIRGIHVFPDGDGIEMHYSLILAQIRSHPMYDYRIKVHTKQEAVVEILRRFDDGWKSVGTGSFTEQEAQEAGLLGKRNWNRYQKNMMLARAASNAQRAHAPDVFFGPVYAQGEIPRGGETEAVDAEYTHVEDVPDTSPEAEVAEVEEVPDDSRTESVSQAEVQDFAKRAKMRVVKATSQEVDEVLNSLHQEMQEQGFGSEQAETVTKWMESGKQMRGRMGTMISDWAEEMAPLTEEKKQEYREEIRSTIENWPDWWADRAEYLVLEENHSAFDGEEPPATDEPDQGTTGPREPEGRDEPQPGGGQGPSTDEPDGELPFDEPTEEADQPEESRDEPQETAQEEVEQETTEPPRDVKRSVNMLKVMAKHDGEYSPGAMYLLLEQYGHESMRSAAETLTEEEWSQLQADVKDPKVGEDFRSKAQDQITDGFTWKEVSGL